MQVFKRGAMFHPQTHDVCAASRLTLALIITGTSMTGSVVFDDLGPDGQFITDILNIETSVMQKKTMKDVYARNTPTDRANRAKKNQDKNAFYDKDTAEDQGSNRARSSATVEGLLYKEYNKRP